MKTILVAGNGVKRSDSDNAQSQPPFRQNSRSGRIQGRPHCIKKPKKTALAAPITREGVANTLRNILEDSNITFNSSGDISIAKQKNHWYIKDKSLQYGVYLYRSGGFEIDKAINAQQLFFRVLHAIRAIQRRIEGRAA